MKYERPYERLRSLNRNLKLIINIDGKFRLTTGCFKSSSPFLNREKYCFPNCQVYEAMQGKNQCLHFYHTCNGVTSFVFHFLNTCFGGSAQNSRVFPFVVCLQNLHDLTIFFSNVHVPVIFSMFLISIFQIDSKLKVMLVYSRFKSFHL